MDLKLPKFDRMLFQIDTFVTPCMVYNDNENSRKELQKVLNVMHKNDILITALNAKTVIGLYHLLLHYEEKEALMLLWILDMKLLRFYDKLTSILVQSFNLGYETRRRVLDIISRK